jgi:hypothetical protein
MVFEHAILGRRVDLLMHYVVGHFLKENYFSPEYV